jgi:hypothetical protein
VCGGRLLSSQVAFPDAATAVNGYFIRLRPGSRAADPARWRVDATPDPAASAPPGPGWPNGSLGWAAVGASVWRGQGASLLLFPQVSEARGEGGYTDVD